MLLPPGVSPRSAYTRTVVLPGSCPRATSLVLFYAYRHLAEPRAVADAQAELCASLQLTGRVLVAAEGINGTLAGTADAVAAYEAALCAHPELRLRPDDFKRSAASSAADPFSRECFVLVVEELVATGGAFTAVPLELTGRGYLRPSEWREALLAGDEDTVVVDVRNRNETALGSFAGALDPKTRSFAEFAAWASANAESFADKRVLLFCTGGVRCEKASAVIRAAGLAREVQHLQGGIHKYLDSFAEDGLWRGKNVVFDRRGCLGGANKNAHNRPSLHVMGRCVGCDAPFEEMDGAVACTVCREPVLACHSCRLTGREQHCEEHAHLRGCFFRHLRRFSEQQLEEQLAQLRALQAQLQLQGRKSAGRRRTLAAQEARVLQRLQQLQAGEEDPPADDVQVPLLAARHVLVSGLFPTDAEAARACWPVRIWPLSARPWAFIKADGAPLVVEVECKITEEGGGDARLAPKGRPARTRFWVDGEGREGTSRVAVQPFGDEHARQVALHLGWLGFEEASE